MKYTIEGELPHDEAAERTVLGSILIDPKCLPDVAAVVAPEDFFHPAHHAVFEAMIELERGNAPVDHLSVIEYLRSGNLLQRLNAVGGVEYLQELKFEIVTASSVAFHARSVARKAERRRWVQSALKVVTTGLAGGQDDAFLEDAEREVMALTTKRKEQNAPSHVKSFMREVVKDLEARYERRNDRVVTGIASGLFEVDVFTLGWQPSELVIIAGRPSMGKTSLAMCAAVEAARAGHPVLIFSLEMGRKSLVERVIAMEGLVDSSAMRSGHLDAPAWVKLTKSFGRIVQMPLWIDEETGLRIGDIRSRARRWKMHLAETAVPLIVVDYIGLVRPDNDNPRNREREVAQVSAGLKSLAKEMACPVLAVSQLNRAVEKQTDKRPSQADLRESGSIEQDADVIALLYRDEYYHDEAMGQCERCDEGNKGVAEVIIAKQRNGPTGVAHVGWKGECTKFVNLSRRDS